MLVSNNTSGESADEETYDSEKDPEYVLIPHVKENCKLIKKNFYLLSSHKNILL